MKISIITVTKNNEAGLLRAIECVRNQKYNNIEHIIVDGGSTDGTKEILRRAQNNILRQAQDDIRAGKGDILRQAQDDSKSNVILNDLPVGKAGIKDLNPDLDSSSSTQNDIRVVDSGLRRNDINSKNNSLPTTNLPTGQAGYQLLSISEPDEGIYDAINKGIKLATGDVIGLLHSDDLYADENVLEKYAEVFNSDSGQPACRTGRAGMTGGIEAVYSDLVYVRQKSNVKSQISKDHPNIQSNNHSIIRYWKTQEKEFTTEAQRHKALQKGWMPPHPTLFIRKEIFDRYGLYRTDMRIAADYEMILRLLYKHKITSYYLPVTTYLMSIGGASNRSLKNILQKSKEDYQAMKMNGINFPLFALASKNLRKLPQFLARDLS